MYAPGAAAAAAAAAAASMYAAQGYPQYLGYPTAAYSPMQAYYPALAYSYPQPQLRPTIMVPVSNATSTLFPWSNVVSLLTTV